MPLETRPATDISRVCIPTLLPVDTMLRSWLRLAFTDQVAHRERGDEHLERCDSTAADAGQEPLRDDAGQRAGELHADLRLPLTREHVDDAIERLAGVVGVQRREHEVAGLRDGERGLDGLGVAHLADEDDVRVLAERRAQRPLERVAVDADLALVDGGALVTSARTRSGLRW